MTSPISNDEIVELFNNMAAMLEIKGDSVFKIRAYQRAANTIDQLSWSLAVAAASGDDLRKIPGVGKAISEKVREYVATGQVAAYDRLAEELPPNVLELLEVPGMGPKTVKAVVDELGIGSVAELEQAALDGRLAQLPRMGKRSVENILRHIRAHRMRSDRTPLGIASEVCAAVSAQLFDVCANLVSLTPAGSLRRWEETIGDIDLIAVSDNPSETGVALAGLPSVREVLVQGDAKTSVVVDPGIQIDLRTGEPDALGAMLQYFTGSQQHNIRLRDYANRQGLSLNEYGITTIETGNTEHFADEASFYARLGLPWIPPELRRGADELDAARDGNLPNLVTENDLKGDLHLHSDWSDGKFPLEEMVAAVAGMGYQYMALTDHSQGLGVANGLTPDRLARQIEVLRSLQDRYAMTILCGSEVDIRADGAMDFPDDVLAMLDWVVASVHNAMGQDRATMTGRISRAMENPHVTVIGHASARLLGRRDPVDFDIESLLQTARDTGTAMELNAAPERLDLKDTHAARARELGVPLVINTDSHHTDGLKNRRFGVAVARRARCGPEHVLNTYSTDEFLAWLRSPKSQRTARFDAMAAARVPVSRQ
jgi:DNA polymerase (family 10)